VVAVTVSEKDRYVHMRQARGSDAPENRNEEIFAAHETLPSFAQTFSFAVP
jgi:hypothetical protein